MITELRITDLGVINDATITPDPGLTVVTGETGAGKTMIVTGIDLLLGGRADPRAVRHDAKRAKVEGRFGLEQHGDGISARVDAVGGELDDGELIVARHVTPTGRSRAYVGGAQVPATVCADLTGELVTICGQSEQVRLGVPERQRSLLDRYAGDDHLLTLQRYRSVWSEHVATLVRLTELRAQAQARAREIDQLTFGLREIERVDPEPDEDLALAAEADRLQRGDDVRLAAQETVVAIAGEEDDPTGGALGALATARRSADRLASVDPGAGDLSKRVAELAFLATEAAADLARYLDDLEIDPHRLEHIAERRSALAGLTRKYGSTVAEVLQWSAASAGRLTELGAADDSVEELAARVDTLREEAEALADIVSVGRREAAAQLSEKVLSELAALAMPHARLSFRVTRGETLGSDGRDAVELLFSANPGSEPRSLAKVASGGELSRIRLALEVVLATRTAHTTFVFDEVDAGVGGAVAVEIGRRLATLAKTTQVIVVTHLAQVAAFADRHFVVVKSDDGQVTTSGVTEVSDTGRAEELARMMAGLETTDTALAHAGELVALALSHRTRASEHR